MRSVTSTDAETDGLRVRFIASNTPVVARMRPTTMPPNSRPIGRPKCGMPHQRPALAECRAGRSRCLRGRERAAMPKRNGGHLVRTAESAAPTGSRKSTSMPPRRVLPPGPKIPRGLPSGHSAGRAHLRFGHSRHPLHARSLPADDQQTAHQVAPDVASDVRHGYPRVSALIGAPTWTIMCATRAPGHGLSRARDAAANGQVRRWRQP
ncbi:hypothetical protein B0G71_1395 [Paraburkholderia sp. BL27I4N3]|nr:hypothetical protein B0G71_1395 [Paraburkholderia sp. BL27I4N3]